MSRDKLPCLYIVIPCYNEEAVLPLTSELFSGKIQSLVQKNMIASDSKVMFVDDGSSDSTWDIISELSKKDPVFTGISLSRNRGHQNALLAGLMTAKALADVTISIDCDGQDDIDAMDEMIEAYHDGYEIVYGVRSKRDTDTFFKRFTAESYYKLLNRLGGEVVYNHADYRLVSSRVLESFSEFEEVNIYLRGLFPLVGFDSTSVSYERHERIAGESHYPLRKMLALAFDGITSLSVKPIRLITSFGLLISFFSFVLIVWTLISYFAGLVVPGWSSTVLAICLLGGIQLISLGVIGEYVGRIYLETKRRPRFVVDKRTETLPHGDEDDPIDIS